MRQQHTHRLLSVLVLTFLAVLTLPATTATSLSNPQLLNGPENWENSFTFSGNATDLWRRQGPEPGGEFEEEEAGESDEDPFPAAPAVSSSTRASAVAASVSSTSLAASQSSSTRSVTSAASSTSTTVRSVTNGAPVVTSAVAVPVASPGNAAASPSPSASARSTTRGAAVASPTSLTSTLPRGAVVAGGFEWPADVPLVSQPYGTSGVFTYTPGRSDAFSVFWRSPV
ncbi:hypothetical protein HDU67_010294 [Dinochytrium kinnereticum]|nr:hypothetical protein HDU67_010294 [Dinochytrium kinnereticum]